MPIHKVSPAFIQWCLKFSKFTAGSVQTESGGNGKFGFNSEPYFPVPTVPQPLDVFDTKFGAFDLAGYMNPSSLTVPVHPSESTQSLRHGPRQE